MNRYGLFEAFGVELEYMIVREGSLAVNPLADTIFIRETGWPCSCFEAGDITWSNEIMLHVIELKTTRPERNLDRLPDLFADSVNRINDLLKTDEAYLLPTAAHPLMDPSREGLLWPHESTEIYNRYDHIFDCSGHGWSNIQSTHINLPFNGDAEFGLLHAALRFIMPLIPGLCASSPVSEGVITGWHDTRMKHYRDNQKKIPVIAGKIVPEPVYTQKKYERTIFRKIEKAISPHDPDRILDKNFLNSRGVIARFDRNSIEVRVMDIQESPLADMACAALIIGAVQGLCREKWGPVSAFSRFPTRSLQKILWETSWLGDGAVISDSAYLRLLGAGDGPVRVTDLWRKLFENMSLKLSDEIRNTAVFLLNRGCLATSLLRDLGPEPDRNTIISVWEKTARCLRTNTLYT